MNFLIKIFLYIISTLLFGFLVFSTFLLPQYKKIESINTDNALSQYETIYLSWGITEKKIFIENISQIDNIYYTNSWSYNKKIESDKIIFELNNGSFFININDLTKEYIFKSKWIKKSSIKISPLWTWLFYIDINNEKINILSKNTVLKLWFLDTKSWNLINNAYLYPHEIIKLKDLRLRNANWVEINPIQKNSDFLRIKKHYFKSLYIKTVISDNNNNNSLIWRSISKKSLNFFNATIKDINTKNKLYDKKYNYIKTLNSWNFPLLNYINNNITYLRNDSKKIVYYKNKIINNILKLFWEKNTKTYITRNKIKEDLISLKNIDNNEYQSMLKLMNYFYYVIVQNNSLENKNILSDDINIIRKINFYNLKLDLEKKSKPKLFLSYIYIKTSFNMFDNWNISELNKYINNFIKILYKDIETQNKYSNINNIKENNNLIEYLNYYLGNYIYDSFKLNKPIKDTMELINNYIILSEKTYFKSSSNTSRIKTWIYEGLSFLDKFTLYIRKQLFKEKRNNHGLLININNNIENIKLLNKNINIYTLNFNKNILSLENERKYNLIKIKLKEYFEALLDYQLYLNNNDKAKENILNSNTYRDTSNDNVKLSFENFNKYILQFDWINKNSINSDTVEIVDNMYYKVNKIYINWVVMSFHLYPSLWNKIDKIFLDWVPKNKQKYYNSSLFLDEQKKQMDKKITTASKEDEYKYDFKRFFINKFIKKENKKKVTQENKTTKNIKDEKVIIIFKSEKLLWKNWEFKIIRNFVKLNYSNILVNRNLDKYDINIDWALFSLKQDKSIDNKFWLLYSSYILDNNYHYFKDISIKYYSKHKDEEEILWINWTKVKFIWKINLTDLEKELSTFMWNTENITLIYNTIYNNFIEINNLKIIYNLINKQIIIKFTNKKNNIEIYFKWSNIVKVKNNSNDIEWSWTINNLTNILSTIK